MSKKLFFSLLVCLLCMGLFLTGCPEDEEVVDDEEEEEVEEEAPDKLVFGGARPQSGPYEVFEETAFGPIYRMWMEEVNERGGIYVEEYDQRIEVEPKIYDCTSDLSTMTDMLERLIVEDEVDFLLPPVSTAFLFAAGPIAQEHEMVMIGAEGGCSSIVEDLAAMEYFFSSNNFADHQIPPTVDLLEEEGIEDVGIIYLDDLHGVEYLGVAEPELEEAGIEIAFTTGIPMDIEDLSPQISQAMDEDVDALMSFAYPDQNFPLVGTAMEMGFNPDVFLIGPGGNMQSFKDDVFGPAVEGIMGFGAWNDKSSPEAAEFHENFVEFVGDETIQDWWGNANYYASLQAKEQAIEKAGTLCHDEIQEVLNNETFDTILGETWFEDGQIAEGAFLGQLGQWIDGKYEVIAPPEQATEDPVVPKPEWPEME